MKIGKFFLREFNIDNEFEKKGEEAIVSKAWHLRLGEVAIKQWSNDAHNIDNDIESLIQNCDHENIIQFLGILMNNESTCIGYIMPYMPMGSLHDVIHNEADKYDQEQISSWITQICCGLSHLHSKNIIHRNVKPSNVLLGKSYDEVKLSDLGLARSAEQKINTLTKGVGTLLYVAPEILKGEEYDISADVYSLSITIWEILHRRTPYDHIASPSDLPHKICNGERPQLNESLLTEVSDLLTRCWHADPSKRPTVDYILQSYCNIRSKVSEERTILLLGGGDGMDRESLLLLENDGQNWKQLNIKLPYVVQDHGVQFLNNNLYIFGGYDANNHELDWTFKLSQSLQWEKMKDMEQKRGYISNSSVVLNNKIWVCGGWNREPLKSIEMYDPETNKWKFMKEMNECRSSAAAAVVNGKIFCSGGGWCTSVEYYDPSSDIWTPICNIPQKIYARGAEEIEGHLFVIGEYNDNKEQFNKVWALDITDKQAKWIEKPSMSMSRRWFSIAKIDGKLFVCGGIPASDVEIFDGKVWRNGPKMSSSRWLASAVVIPMGFARDLQKDLPPKTSEMFYPIKGSSFRIADMVLTLICALGILPVRSYFPMCLIRIEGWFKYLGKHSDRVAVLAVLLAVVPVIMAAAECCVARFAITYKWEALIKLFSGYPYTLFQLLQFIGGIPLYLIAYITCSGDYQDVVELATRHNYTHMIQDITSDNVLIFVNTDIPTVPLIITCLGVPLPSAPILLSIIAYLTHRKIVSQMRTTSAENYRLQRNISLLLFAHISLPVFLVLLPTSVMVAVLDFNAVNPHQRDDYGLDLFYVAGGSIAFYPFCNSLMTLLIVKPYRLFLFQIIRKVGNLFGATVSSARTIVVLKGSL